MPFLNITHGLNTFYMMLFFLSFYMGRRASVTVFDTSVLEKIYVKEFSNFHNRSVSPLCLSYCKLFLNQDAVEH